MNERVEGEKRKEEMNRGRMDRGFIQGMNTKGTRKG
jgi:hypothetical protein